jgi:hypothetical protein
VLNNVVHGAAVTQGIIDAFVVIAAATALTVIVIVTRRSAPVGPASHIPLFAPRKAAPDAAHGQAGGGLPRIDGERASPAQTVAP